MAGGLKVAVGGRNVGGKRRSRILMQQNNRKGGPAKGQAY